MGFFQDTQERIRNGRGKRAISVQALKFYRILIQFKCSESSQYKQSISVNLCPLPLEKRRNGDCICIHSFLNVK